jgi:hypothetical protein
MHALMPVSAEQFREISLALDHGGPSLHARLNGKHGWLMYRRHNEGDPGFSSRNSAFDPSNLTPDAPAFISRFDGAPTLVIEYRLGNGQMDAYPASWALPEQEIMQALKYFIEHEGNRAPFVNWHDDSL